MYAMSIKLHFLILLCLVSLKLHSQVLEYEWKYKADFEKMFNGKYYIDENDNCIIMYPEIVEIPDLSKEAIMERVVAFANKRQQKNVNNEEDSHYTRSENSIILVESSPWIKNGKHALMDNYVSLIYAFRIDVKEEAVRLTISINNSRGIVGGFGSWPMTKHFKKQGIKTYTYFYDYALALLKEAKQYILQQNEQNESDNW